MHAGTLDICTAEVLAFQCIFVLLYVLSHHHVYNYVNCSVKLEGFTISSSRKIQKTFMDGKLSQGKSLLKNRNSDRYSG